MEFLPYRLVRPTKSRVDARDGFFLAAVLRCFILNHHPYHNTSFEEYQQVFIHLEEKRLTCYKRWIIIYV